MVSPTSAPSLLARVWVPPTCLEHNKNPVNEHVRNTLRAEGCSKPFVRIISKQHYQPMCQMRRPRLTNLR